MKSLDIGIALIYYFSHFNDRHNSVSQFLPSLLKLRYVHLAEAVIRSDFTITKLRAGLTGQIANRIFQISL